MTERNLDRLDIVGFISMVLLIMLIAVGCGQPVVYTQPVQQPVVVQQSQPQYEIIQDPNTGVQYSVFYDNGIQQMVELSLFMGWMNRGGYSYVIHHYHDNPTYYRRYDSRTYSSYRRLPRNSPSFRSTPSGATSRPQQFRSTPSSSPARSAPSFRPSSSSGSRSTPTFRSSKH